MLTAPAARLATEMQPQRLAAVSLSMWQVVYKGAFFTAASAFAIGDWTLTNPVTDGDLTVTVLSLPTSAGTITDIEYRVDGGAWVSSAGTGTFTISGLANTVQVSVDIRSISAYGTSSSSDVKTGTPTAV